MSVHQRYRVLLVEPLRLWRNRAAEETRLRLEIVGVGTEAEARAAVTGTVHAVVLSLKQLEANGLVLGRRLREKLGMEPYFLVHGQTMPPKSTEERATLAARHNIDMWLPNALEPHALVGALWGELERRFRPIEQRRAAAREESADDEPSWSELLRAPATVDNVKKLLTKDIGPGRRGAWRRPRASESHLARPVRRDDE